MNVFGVGLPEMAIIFVIALLVFGPKKLPEIGRTFGKTLRSFQDASREFQEGFEREAREIEKVAKTSMEATLETKPTPTIAEPQSLAPAKEGLDEAGASSEGDQNGGTAREIESSQASSV